MAGLAPAAAAAHGLPRAGGGPGARPARRTGLGRRPRHPHLRPRLLHPRQLAGPARAGDGLGGPWPIDERWWDARTAVRYDRFQVVDSGGVAWLLLCLDGEWAAEARYD
ncbi:hypothetical protein Q0F99_17635 [Rathayibacter oskolensis]|uniref:hypothetical protein n=1 Tax=Rathayibacter oskolensis TaxID=1891671 RepID=UPI00265E67B4|nr:hypothetical protein [Rathayibacter oskolensis]WKK71265.1 hypothetical protein Q0F99_17635 [Rathayibacter oskolensis]